MQLFVDPKGTARCIYGEELDLSALGSLTIRRASHVEPGDDGRWFVDLSPVRGPRLGPFDLRSAALASEQRWLERHLNALSQSCRVGTTTTSSDLEI
jgi:hypothetical protein